MNWTDEGLVLSCRPHGESAAIISALTAARGRHAGLVHGGLSTRNRPLYQPGNLLRLEWRARLAEHLGNFRAELLGANAGRVLDDPAALAGLIAACAIVDASLPEREPHAAIFEALAAYAAAIGQPGWPVLHVHLELGLLQELGYRLDLSSCALTGSVEDLAYVSPRSGRAVTRSAAEPWRGKLLPLPPFLASRAARELPGPADILQGLELTGHFIEQHMFWPHNRPLPPARARLIEILKREAAGQGSQ